MTGPCLIVPRLASRACCACYRQSKKVDFIELFNEKLLVKQEGESLHIIDVHTHTVVDVDRTEFVTPSAFVFLYEKNVRIPAAAMRTAAAATCTCSRCHMHMQPCTTTCSRCACACACPCSHAAMQHAAMHGLVAHSTWCALWRARLAPSQLFLTFRQRQVTVWNFKGEQVSSFEDHSLWHPETNTNVFFITASQEFIISYCRPSSHSSRAADDSTTEGRAGTVHVSHILSGQCVARIAPDGADGENDANGLSHVVCGNNPFTSESPMSDVTALYFSEERNELYVGNQQGVLHIWRQ